MMKSTDSGMHGWLRGGMWGWTMIGTLLVVLLVVAIVNIFKK